MRYKIWMLDIARELAPTREHLFQFAAVAQESGFDLGLYLEHRFAYASQPWAQGLGCVTPAIVRDLRSEFPSLKIIPFINVLAHVEGFIYSEEGRAFREENFKGLQGCPCSPDFVKFCEDIIDDTVQDFDSELIHIGGDETTQLGKCPKCQNLGEGHEDPKAAVYAHHFKPLLDRVVKQGRKPGVWGDMLLQHPDAAPTFPKETVIFDWQYDGSIADTAPKLQAHGFEVVGCPGFHIWDAAWFHTEASEKNIRQISKDIQSRNLDGFCLTAWEYGLFGSVETTFPAVKWASRAAENPDIAETMLDEYAAESKLHGEWARLMSVELEKLGGVFKYDGHRSRLKSRLLMYSNPFLAWLHHADQLCGRDGDRAIEICNQALQLGPTEAERGISVFVRSGVEFVRIAEVAHQAYARKDTEKAVAALAPTRYLFDTLHQIARHSHERIGGSMADISRCIAAKHHVETVIKRIRDYGNGELGYLPAFAVITNPRFVPHDQACWWLVNQWGNE